VQAGWVRRMVLKDVIMNNELPPIFEIGKAIGFSIVGTNASTSVLGPDRSTYTSTPDKTIRHYFRITEIKGRWVHLEEIEKPQDDRTSNYSRGWWNTDLFIEAKEAPLSVTDPKLFKELMAKAAQKRASDGIKPAGSVRSIR